MWIRKLNVMYNLDGYKSIEHKGEPDDMHITAIGPNKKLDIFSGPSEQSKPVYEGLGQALLAGRQLYDVPQSTRPPRSTQPPEPQIDTDHDPSV